MSTRAAASPARKRAASPRITATGPTGSAGLPVVAQRSCSWIEEQAPTPHLTALWKERQREPCYLACRLWGVNALDVKAMKAVVVFRIHIIFRPRAAAMRFLPPHPARISSVDPGWTDELLEALPTFGIQNGKETDANEKKEVFRVVDAQSSYARGEPELLWFPPLPAEPERGATICALTYKIEATDVQLDMQFEEFPFDAHLLKIKVFLPKKHKDRHYELVCDDEMRIASEHIFPRSRGGKGIFEVKDAVVKSLFEWSLMPEKTVFVADDAKGEQSGATLVLGIRRRPQFYVDKFITRPGTIATLACVSTFIPTDAIGDRLSLTFTILLTLTGINYSSSDSLPTLPYSTALDLYHEACHNFVYVVIAHNVLFYLLQMRCAACAGARADAPVCAGAADATGERLLAGDDVPTAGAAGSATLCGSCDGLDALLGTYVDDAAMLIVFVCWLLWNVRWFHMHKQKY